MKTVWIKRLTENWSQFSKWEWPEAQTCQPAHTYIIWTNQWLISSSISISFFAFNFVLHAMNAMERMTSLCRDDVFHFQLKCVIHFIPFLALVLCSISFVAFIHSDSFHSECQRAPLDDQMSHNVSHRLISFDANTNRNILSFIQQANVSSQQMNDGTKIDWKMCAHQIH